MSRIRPPQPYRRTRVLITETLVMVVWALAAVNAAEGEPAGVQLDLMMREVVQTDPPESDVIDTLSALVPYEQEVTFRLANATVYVSATATDESTIRIQYSIFVTGPVPDQRIDEVYVEYGVPLIIDDIKGKGKSHYRLQIVPNPRIEMPPGDPLPTEESGWLLIPSAHYHFHVSPQSRAMYHFPEFRNALEYEYEAIRDTFDFTAPGRVNYYFFDGDCTDIVMDSRFDFGVDPSRNRIVARYDPWYSGVDVQAMLLLNFYRWWGYAPELLALGASGYLTFADYHVLADRADGHAIPLSALARSIDFKRQPFPASYHHAASFVRWLIASHGHAAFRELYSRATDLSLERAFWSVYEKTLDELEADWLAFLGARKFGPPELYHFAKRAAAYRNYEEHYHLLRRSAAAADEVPAQVQRELGLAAAQLGLWEQSLDHLHEYAESSPTNQTALSLLSEAFWAYGDTNACQYYLLRQVELDPSDARPYVLLGELQEAWRRPDSAVPLWRIGLEKSRGEGPIALELLLRLGRSERRCQRPDSAQVLFAEALAQVHRLLQQPTPNTLTLIRLGETLMELDSVATALPYLELAAYVADAPQEVGRALLNIGHCHDLAGRRDQALKAYEAVFEIPATHYDLAAAHFYVNHVYRH